MHFVNEADIVLLLLKKGSSQHERVGGGRAGTRRMTHSCDSGKLSAGAEQAALQQVSLLDDTLHGSGVIRAHLDLLAGRQQCCLQGVLREHTTYQQHLTAGEECVSVTLNLANFSRVIMKY